MTGFHDKALRLLPIVPEISAAGVVKIADVEARIGRSLPAAVRDWYMREGACAILQTYSNQDPPVVLDDLGRPSRIGRKHDEARDLVSEGLLHIRTENQGVCLWAVQLDDLDDPPVVVTYDLDGLTGWQPHSDTFSDYIYSGIWDWGLVLASNFLIQAQNVPLTEATLERLRLGFREDVTTNGWPGDKQYRFEGSGQRLLIWSTRGQADWYLSADNGSSLSEAAKTIWLLDDVGKAFWSNTDEGKVALAHMVAGMPAQTIPITASRLGGGYTK